MGGLIMEGLHRLATMGDCLMLRTIGAIGQKNMKDPASVVMGGDGSAR